MVIDLKTGYEWSLQEKLRLLDLKEWSTEWPFYMDSYYEEKITYNEFFLRIKQCKIKPNSTPRKTDMFLEYRMYGMVPYNLSPIQQGIQFGHAVVEYGQMVKDIPPFEGIYDKFARKDKTFIILNGGTTNENFDRLGSLQQHSQILKDNNILVAEFKEPDLNDTLTAIVFLIDERVFKKDIYPDFEVDVNSSELANERQYQQWLEKIGGDKNLFLRNYLTKFKLA
jgi:hypothetical protein